MSKYYQLDYYWPTTGYTSFAEADLYYPVRPIKPPVKLAEEDEIESKLRSFNEIMGYRIRATDGKMGQVHDILVDDENWQIVYVIIDTSKWKPWSKKVILSNEWMDTISYVNSELNINLNSDQIKNAPEFDPEHPIGMDYSNASLCVLMSSLLTSLGNSPPAPLKMLFPFVF